MGLQYASTATPYCWAHTICLWSANPFVWIGQHLIYEVISWCIVYVTIDQDLLADSLHQKDMSALAYFFFFSFFQVKSIVLEGGSLCYTSRLQSW